MNYVDNTNDLSQLKYINGKNQLSNEKIIGINNHYIKSDVNQMSPYINHNMNFYNNNSKKVKNNRNNSKKISIKKSSLFIEEIKNYNLSNEYYSNYDYTPSNFNYYGIKELSPCKKINNINKSQNQNTLCDYLLCNQKKNNKIKIMNHIQIQNISLNLLSNNNYLYQNKENNSFHKINHNQDISPIKNNIFTKKKINNYNQIFNKENFKDIKKQIIFLKRDNSYSYNNYNNSVNGIDKIEDINNIPNIPENDNYNKYESESIFSIKKNQNKNQKRINIIPIPKKYRKVHDSETRRKLFYSNNNDQNINLYIKPRDNRNGSNSVKKNLINIDINLDFDKNAQNSFQHKKIKSSFMLENNSFIKQISDDKNIDNISTISKSPQSYSNKKLCKYNSAKALNKNIKNNELKIKNNIENGAIRKIGKDAKIKKRNQKSNQFLKFKSFNELDNSYNINRINRTLNAISDKYRILWGGKSQAGKDSNGNTKINQDAFKVYENVNCIRNFNIFILSDGHGKDGHHVSHFTVENLTKKIISHPSISILFDLDQIYRKLKEHNYQIIKNIFSEIDKYLSEQKQYDTYTSGATCVLIIQIGNKIICANLGDSRAILIYEDSNNNNESNLLNTKVYPLSLESKPDLPSEKKRIINCGGEVHRGKNRKGIYAGPMRVFPKGESYSGLAMSRSLGDFKMKKYGVINEPSFVEYNLDEFSKYIVLCSDGVWDFMDNENVMKIGNKHYLNNNPNGFCEEIIGNAAYWWEKEDIIIDDITALIIFFKN